MKQYIITILAALVMAAALPVFNSCDNEKVEIQRVSAPEVSIQVSDVDATSAYVSITNTGSPNFKFSNCQLMYSTSSSFVDSKYASVDSRLQNLSKNTTYYLKVVWGDMESVVYEDSENGVYITAAEIGMDIKCTGDLSFTTRKNGGNPSMTITAIAPMSDNVYIEAINGNEDYELSDFVIEVSTSDKFTSFQTGDDVTESDGNYSCYLWNLEPSTKYYFRIKGKAYDIVNKKYSTITMFAEGNFTTRGKVTAVDLGLSVKWADCNLGANNSWELGTDFYFGSAMNGSSISYTKLPANIAGTKYDAATIEYGEPWQLPTIKQWEELLDKCIVEETTERGVSVWKFTSVLNDNSIIIPFGSYTRYYWTSNLDTSTNKASYVQVGRHGFSFYSTGYDKYYGRAVCK